MLTVLRRCLLAAVACVVIVQGGVHAGPPPEPLGYTSLMDGALSRGLEAIRATDTTPSLSVAVVARGRIVFAQALGCVDLMRARAATPHTRYAVGSITKMFTAVAVMRLVERGRIGLDEIVACHLPWAPHAAEITVRQLLTHRSGLPNYLDDALRNGSTAKPTTPRGIVASLASRPLDFAPGTAYAYSNTNYVLLGLLVETVTKQPLASVLRDDVFEPAGMVETTVGFPPSTIPLASGSVTTPEDGARWAASPGDLTWYYACGDVVSTAPDLARFDIALMGGVLVRPATFVSMASSASATGDAVGSRYGFGLQCVPLPGERFLVGHHGGLPGYESDDEMIPSDGFAVVVLGNDFQFATGPVLRLVLNTFYPAMVAALPAWMAQRAATHLLAVPPVHEFLH